MLRHVALFTWRDETTEGQIAALRDALGALAETIPTIRSYWFGEDVNLRDGNHHFAVVADFDDASGFTTYVDHPDHQAVIRNHIEPMRAASARVQFEI